MDKGALLEEVRRDVGLIDRLGVGLSDVTDERNVKLSRTSVVDGRVVTTVSHLRREAPFKEGTAHNPLLCVGPVWYAIRNGISSGYVDDRRALLEYVSGGEQLTLPV